MATTFTKKVPDASLLQRPIESYARDIKPGNKKFIQEAVEFFWKFMHKLD